MTKTLRAVFDGAVLRPDEPVDLKPNTRYVVTIEREEEGEEAGEEGAYPLTEILELPTDSLPRWRPCSIHFSANVSIIPPPVSGKAVFAAWLNPSSLSPSAAWARYPKTVSRYFYPGDNNSGRRKAKGLPPSRQPLRSRGDRC